MCDLQIVIVIHDKMLDRLTTYSSGSKPNKNIFQPKDALQRILEKEAQKKSIK